MFVNLVSVTKEESGLPKRWGRENTKLITQFWTNLQFINADLDMV